METLDIRGWFAPASLHVAASDPCGARSDANGIVCGFWPTCNAGIKIVAHHGAHGVSAVAIVVTWFLAVETTGIAPAIFGINLMNGVMPVVIMGNHACIGLIPTICANQGFMSPGVSGVLTGNDDAFAGDSLFPGPGCLDALDPPRRAPFTSLDGYGGAGGWFEPPKRCVRGDLLNLWILEESVQKACVELDTNGVDYPESLIRHACLF